MNANLQKLRTLLLNPDWWPDDFEWYYGNWLSSPTPGIWCGCAGGLAEHLGMVSSSVPDAIQAQELGLTDEQFQAIFFDAPDYLDDCPRMEDVTPRDVVRVIDEVTQ